MSGYVMNRESLKKHCEEMCERFGASDIPYTSGTYGEHRLVLELLKQTEWIPVSERLPENTQPVLMTIRRMSNLYSHEPFITVGHISWNQTTWWCAHDGDCVRNEIEVLAWMPLPEPYKSESEEEE